MGAKYVFNPLTGNLDTTDVVAFNGEVDLGTAAAPSVFFTGDTNTGIYSPGPDTVAISTNGAQRLLIDANGSLTATSANALVANFTGPANAYAQVTDGTGIFRAQLISNLPHIGAASNHSLVFTTNNTERMRLDTSGRLGLGTSSPEARFQIAGSSSSTTFSGSEVLSENRIYTGGVIEAIQNNSNTNGGFAGLQLIANENSGTFQSIGLLSVSTGGGSAPSFVITQRTATSTMTERLRIDPSGRVGIGNNAPSYILDIRTDANSNQLAYIANANTGSSAAASLTAATGAGDISLRAHSAAHSVWPSTGLIATTSGLSGGLAINSAGSTALQLLTNSTERARIDSSGRLLVGTSSQSGGSLLQVNDNRIRIATAKTPASATDTGVAGEICWDANYIYVCTATDTWKRTAISTW